MNRIDPHPKRAALSYYDTNCVPWYNPASGVVLTLRCRAGNPIGNFGSETT